MRIGLASECKNRNVSFNMTQIEKAMRESQGKVDLPYVEMCGIVRRSSKQNIC